MTKLGRNDRCHCGSGKKYKSCCLAADQQLERAGRARVQLLGEIFDWLEERHPGFHDQAVSDLLGEGHRELAQRLERALGQGAVREHWLEWALSEAAVEADGTRVTALELLTEDGAPRRDGDVGAYVSALLRAPLQAWSVETCTLTVSLRNLVTGGLVELEEPGLSGFLVEGDVIGLRLFEWNGKWHRFWEPWFCSRELEGMLAGAAADSHLARLIADEWLEGALAALDEPADWEGGVWRIRYNVSVPETLAAKLLEAGGSTVAGRPFLLVEAEGFSAEIELLDADLIVTTATEPESELADAFVRSTWGDLVKFVERDFDSLENVDSLDFEEEGAR